MKEYLKQYGNIVNYLRAMNESVSPLTVAAQGCCYDLGDVSGDSQLSTLNNSLCNAGNSR